MVARCGEVRVKHWAHKGQVRCDVWWESETEWHRKWKNEFPEEWQEIVCYADGGEKHIADVRTDQNWIIEFQHSHITTEERQSREDFYKKLIWVVNGNRRLNDKKRFFKILGNLRGRYIVNNNYPELKTTLTEGALFRDWIPSNTHVFFDFGEEQLWWLLPQSEEKLAFVLPVSQSTFIQLLRLNNSSGIDQFKSLAEKYNKSPLELQS